MSEHKNRNLLSLNRESRQGVAIEERLHKVLANAGLGSRRLLEERIAAGEVKVNATSAETGSSVRSGDRVELDGKAFVAVATEPDEGGVLIYHKPEGEVTTHDDPEGRPTVFERLPKLKGARWVSVGRLDINTTGLLLATTDGELANALMHPSSEIEREYVCRIYGQVDGDMIERLKQGVELEDGPAKFDHVAVISIGENHSWLRVTLREGRNREVRRIWESQDVQVSRLKRIRYGSVELPRPLRRGHYEMLPASTWRDLRESLDLSPIPMTLTLQPVIGVRRAQKQQNEFKPDARKTGAWSGAHHDEARELRAFDFVREDKPAPGNARRGRGKTGGRRGGPGQPQAGNGNAGGMRQPPWRQNPAEIRSWNAGAPGEGRPGKRRSGKKRGGPGQRGNAAMTHFPSDHAYAQRGRDGGRAAGPHGGGPRPAGPHGGAPRAAGPHGGGPRPAGPHGGGPRPAGPPGPGGSRRRGRHRQRAPH